MANRLADILQRAMRAGSTMPIGGTSRLQELADFGPNPGALNARIYLPPNFSTSAPLVVVLHGCTQTAGGYDRGSGWSRLADIGGFALLFPEQRRENNPNLCFNWFVPDDIRRGGGEAASIHQMIEAMEARYPIDAKRIFVTGLSAGGAMAAVMLATYPEVFAGGSVIAGLPYGCAANVPQALKRMRGEGQQQTAQLVDRLRGAADHQDPWPTLTVWHGTADATVHPSNAQGTLEQWRAVHGLGEQPDRVEDGAGYVHRVWLDANGAEALRSYTITGMGHGTPLNTSGRESCGVAGPFMLDVGVSSSCIDARSWGLLDEAAVVEALPAEGAASSNWPGAEATTPWRLEPEKLLHGRASAARGTAVGNVIEEALRKAGLMR